MTHHPTSSCPVKTANILCVFCKCIVLPKPVQGYMRATAQFYWGPGGGRTTAVHRAKDNLNVRVDLIDKLISLNCVRGFDVGIAFCVCVSK